ncbi:hypothetical protein JD79_02194 [Geodermatophilus normandii]|uniref:Uncharacterized protein n=1 Tax=Geodermatophilus normandii TaxID=1137989 RepID=A0A317QIZ1_9ACTN|nr:hypothetical protein [Geodermatophilus normandii]PWW23029.1 hypothetical protein JD79_02194 [Geodermatophilus normandii]
MGVALSNRRGARERQLRNVLVGASALAALDLLTALRSRGRRRNPVPSSDARPGATGLVAQLVDVRPALAGEPRKPVVPASVATGSDVRATDALTTGTPTTDALTTGTPTTGTPTTGTPTTGTPTTGTRTTDALPDTPAGAQGGPAVS